jgi:hypothetical protein
MPPSKGSKQSKPQLLYAAAYENATAALADLDAIQQLHENEVIGSYDAAVIDQKDGKPHIVKRMDRPRARVIPEAFGSGSLPRKELQEAAKQLRGRVKSWPRCRSTRVRDMYSEIASNKRRSVILIGLFFVTWLAIGAARGFLFDAAYPANTSSAPSPSASYGWTPVIVGVAIYAFLAVCWSARRAGQYGEIPAARGFRD